jgi:hypothetical protein
MSTDHKHAGTFFPHQMSKDEFARWWNQINEQSTETPNKAPGVIYLGQDAVEEADSI